jgi:UDP-glucose:(heptosyl)LPS alpha-1,3-glucosyltransferase
MIREDVRSEFGIPDERLHLVYQSVDTDHFSPARCAELRGAARRELGLSADTTCFLFVGHAFRRKGLRELLEAAGRLRRRTSGFRLVVAGRGPRLAYSIRARLAGCGGLVDFVGGVRDVVRLFAAADAFVFPTWYDAFGRVVLEAAACGLPVVVTRANNGSSEVVTHGREGLLVDTPADRDALAEKMAELMDPALRARMGAAARTMAEGFDRPTFLNSILRVFETAARTAALPAAEGVSAAV